MTPTATATSRKSPRTTHFLSVQWKLLVPTLSTMSLSVILLLFFVMDMTKDHLVEVTEANVASALEGVSQTLEVDRMDRVEHLLANLRAAHRVFHATPLAIDEAQRLRFDAVDQVSKVGHAVEVPAWSRNGTVVHRSSELVDAVKGMVGCEATIFQKIDRGFMRIATTVLKPDGTRAVGTYVSSDSPVALAVERGETYRGRAFVVSDWYTTAYEPIRVDGRIVGMLFVGVKEDFSALVDKLGKVRIGASGYLFLANAEGTLLMHPTAKGRNVKDDPVTKDALAHKDIVYQVTDARGEEFMMSARHNDGFDLTLGAVVPRAEIAERVADLTTWFLIIGFSLGGGVLVVMIFASRYFGNGFRGIAKSLGRVAAGDFSTRPPDGRRVIWRDEVWECNGAMNSILETFGRFNDGIRDMIRAATSGDLDRRVDTSSFPGAYRELGDGLNQLATDLQRPVAEAIGVLQKLAEGDLRARMVGNYVGDHGVTKQALNATVDAFNDVLHEIRDTTSEIDRAGGVVGTTGQELSTGTTNLAATVEEISATIKVIATQIDQNALAVGEASGLSDDVRSRAEGGTGLMERLLGGMRDIDDSSREIAKVIKVIDDIAFQTNLLALNASVEAARAQQHGKGFAVVAEEVRNLASRSAGAARETAQLVEASRGKVQRGSELATETATALDSIASGIGQVSQRMASVSEASKQQAEAVHQIDIGMHHIEEVVTKNQRVSEGANDASESLRTLAAQLTQLVDKFELDRVTRRREDARRAAASGALEALRGSLGRGGEARAH